MPSNVFHALALAGVLFTVPACADSVENASRYYEDALKRYERNDDAGAIIQLKNALKEDSRMLPALVLLGQAHLRKGEPGAAERVLADAEKLGASRAQIASYQARAYFDQGKYRALIEKFGTDGLPQQSRLDILLLRSRAQMALSQYDGAMTSARLAEQIKGGEVRALVLQAQIDLNSRRPQDARNKVNKALQLSPRNGEALNVLASIAHAQGDLQTALRDYGRAIEVLPYNVDARLARAAIYLDLKRDADASGDLDFLQKNAPSDPRGAYLRAQSLARQGKVEASRAALRDAAQTLSQLSPELVAASDQLQLLGGLAHHALGEFESAKTYLGDYLEKRPREAGVRKLLGSIYLSERQYDRAITMLQPALRANPDDPRVKAMLASAYMAKGNHGKATLLYQEAAEADDAVDILSGLGVSLMSSGQQESGFEALSRAYRQSPGNAQAGVPLALAWLKRGDPRQAVSVMEAVVKREPRNLAARNLLGVARLAVGDRAGARAAYVTAIQASPSFYTAHLNLARLDEAEGQIAKARQRYLGILKVVPGHLDAMLELGRLEEAAGRAGEAIRWLDKAASLNGKDPRAKLALAALQLRRGQADLALDAAKAAQAITPNSPAVLLALAEGQIATGNSELARATLRRLTQIASFSANWLVQGAAAQMRIGDLEGAEYTLNKALLAEGSSRAARVLKARLSAQQRKFGEAEQQIQALLASGGNPADAQRLLGELRLMQQRAGDAVDAYRKAYASDASGESLFGLYLALMATGQPREAARLMGDWSARHPGDQSARHALGEAWLALGDNGQAGAVYAGLVKANDKDARAHNNLANVLLRQGDHAGALKHAERAHALAPNQPQVNDTLGWVLVQQGYVDKGLRYLREASLRAPDNPEIQAHLEQALQRQRR